MDSTRPTWTPAISTLDPAFSPPTDGKSAETRYPAPPKNETLPSLIERYPNAKIPSTRKRPTATLTFVRSISLSYVHGGPDMAPKPPNARSAPAQPGRSSKSSDGVHG